MKTAFDKTRWHGKPTCRSGAALVEMALVLPVLLVLTFGIIEYGWVFLKASQVNNAARQGVRAAVRPDADTTEVEAAIAEVMNKAGMSGSGYSVVITGVDGSTGDSVSVDVTLNYDNVALMGNSFIPRPEQLNGTATMAKEGPP